VLRDETEGRIVARAKKRGNRGNKKQEKRERTFEGGEICRAPKVMTIRKVRGEKKGQTVQNEA